MREVTGYVLEFSTGGGALTKRIYLSGDTLVYDDLHQIPARYPFLDVGVLHLGGSKVMGIMVTMDADQGVHAAQLIGAEHVLPVHYDDYDVFTSRLAEFMAAVGAAGLSERVTGRHRVTSTRSRKQMRVAESVGGRR